MKKTILLCLLILGLAQTIIAAELCNTIKLDNNVEKTTAEVQYSDSTDNIIYEVVDKVASFPGGDDAYDAWVARNLRYPAEAIERGIHGRVFVNLVVNKDGTFDEVKLMRSPDPLLSEEAIRLVKSMPNWEPALQGGKIVRSRFYLPITFSLKGPEGSGEKKNSVEKNASFPGGKTALYAWLAKNMQYPELASAQGIQGTVQLQFVVDTDGSISEVNVMRSPDPLLSEEAIRLVKKMPKWIPASRNGQPLKSRFNLPINFHLN